jgi:DNA polymerase (family 10)
MPSNQEAAEILRGIADLLDVTGERFKPEAYRRAARSVESLTESLAAVAQRGELRSVPGVGEAIEEKLQEYLKTGKIDYYTRLQKEVPAGVAEMLRIPGLGPKTARLFWVEKGIEGPAELLTALDSGRLAGTKGFGERKLAQIRAAVDAHRTVAEGGRMPIEAAYPIAQSLVRNLREQAGAERVEVAGSFRRGRETVGDLDILVTSSDPARAFDVFSALPEVKEVRLRGPTKETVLLRNGLQVDLRVVDPASFGAALVYFTGSKDHNVQIRTLGKEQGLRVNEYGVQRGEERVAGRTEEDVYRALGLAWVPPEIREAHGEVEAAARGKVPTLVEEKDLQGDLHVHLPQDAGVETVDRLVAVARERHLSYVGVVTEGVDEKGKALSLPEAARARLAAASTAPLRLFQVQEVDLAPSAVSSPERARADWVVVRPTSAAPAPPPSGALPQRVALVAHRGSGLDPHSEEARAWAELARATGAAVEVGSGADRLDSNGARQAREAGLRIALPTGIAEPSDSPTAPVAILFARRGGAGTGDVRNAERDPPFSGGRKGRGG